MADSTFTAQSPEVEVDRLRQSLGLVDPWLARQLHTLGFDASSTCLVPFVPAIELAWIDGLSKREHQRILALVGQRHPDLSPTARRLLSTWLVQPPSKAVVRVVRWILRDQLSGLPPIERPALRARVVGPCVDLAYTSGGLLGQGDISAAETAWLRRLAGALGPKAEGGPVLGHA
mgnify:CR=1 FL=1